MSAEQLFLGQLPLVERVIAWVCARRGLRGADAEDFASAAKTRLIENDYEVLARFEGRSSLKTYLTAVVSRVYLDFQVQRFGKWRPSAEARRLGPLALRLERLLYRDELTLDEACSVLLSDPRVPITLHALHDLHARLPHRAGRAAAAAGLEPLPREDGPASLERSERQALAARVFHAIRAALESRGVGARDAHELLATLDWDGALCGSAFGPASAARGEQSQPRRAVAPWRALTPTPRLP